MVRPVYPVRFEIWTGSPAPAQRSLLAGIAPKLAEMIGATEVPTQTDEDVQDLAKAVEAPATNANRSRGGLQVLQLDFDLGAGAATAGPGGETRTTAGGIAVSKPVLLDGKPAGAVALRIGTDSSIAIDAASLADVLAQEPSEPTLAEGFVTFAALRDRGYAVRYDPVGDRVVITSN